MKSSNRFAFPPPPPSAIKNVVDMCKVSAAFIATVGVCYFPLKANELKNDDNTKSSWFKSSNVLKTL